MKVSELKCPNCGANLKPDLLIKYNVTSCPYCKLQLNISDIDEHIVVDKNIKIDKTINFNKRTTNDAEILRAQIEDAKDRRDTRQGLTLLLLLILIPLAIWGFFIVNGKIAQLKGEVKVGFYGDFVGKKYTAVVPQLEALGFENIETIDLNDAGWFTRKPDTIDTISINGNYSFQSYNYFHITDPVIITYH